MSQTKVKKFGRVVAITTATWATGTLTVTTAANHYLVNGNVVVLRTNNQPGIVRATVTVTNATTFTAAVENFGGFFQVEIDSFYTGTTGAQALTTINHTSGNSAVIQSVVTGTGGSVTAIEVSLNGVNWVTSGTLTNTTVTGNTQFLTIEPAWVFVRPNITSIGAATKLEIWKSA